MTRDTRNLVVFAVASVLTVILIYSSITEVEVIARPKHIDNLCREATPTIKGAVKAEVCCQIINGSISVCIKCQYDANDNSVGSCINFYPERQVQGGNSALPPTSAGASFSSSNNTGLITNGQTIPPSRLGNVHPSGSNNNTGTQPANIITKEHNPASPKVLSSTGNAGNPMGQNQRTSGHQNQQSENSQSGSTNSNPSSGSGSSGKSIKSNNNNKK
ncbi:hypothetical protein [Nitrososphaera sp. AFS]|uniref:hypothetical protein n=1 Tax=Nitrososphaera sp. AFS TaxID=2301191 RepID=UPI001392259B|nr:hypothetical protein [Nitrososphaera sp. AFS]NAL78519.1 hypothetical protein [Nitrososphaera sp. AFS]